MHALPILIILFFIGTALAAVAAAAAQTTELSSSGDRYIVVFKPNATHAAIQSRLQQMHTATQGKLLLENAAPYKSIGQFRWFSGDFVPHTLIATAPTPWTALSNHSGYAGQDDTVVHYYVKDTVFQVQDLVQQNPPSWVSRTRKKKKKRRDVY